MPENLVVVTKPSVRITFKVLVKTQIPYMYPIEYSPAFNKKEILTQVTRMNLAGMLSEIV